MTIRPIGVKKTTTLGALAAAALLVLAVGGCGDGDSSSRAEDPPAATGLSLDDLDGKVFATAQVDGHALVDETVVRIGFADGQVSVDAGCNHMTGGVSLDGDRLKVSNLAGTEIGCEQDRADQDAWVASFLTDGPTAALDGDTLTLTGGDVSMALAAQAVDDASSDGGDPDGTVTDNG